MKIHQIPQGGRFTLEGKSYVKTGPMMAIAEDGTQRVIPRYLVLQAQDEIPASPTTNQSGTLERAQVIAAFEDFLARCTHLIPPGDRDELEAAKKNFLERLNGIESSQQ